MRKAELWVIKMGDGNWTDDAGGDLFVSYAQAERTRQKWVELRPDMHESVIRPCELDEDLAQLGKLYHESENLPVEVHDEPQPAIEV